MRSIEMSDYMKAFSNEVLTHRKRELRLSGRYSDGLRAGVSEFTPRRGKRLFSTLFRPAPVPTVTSYWMGNGGLFSKWGLSDRGVKLTTYLHQVPTSRK
jgi:hypothetical protein